MADRPHRAVVIFADGLLLPSSYTSHGHDVVRGGLLHSTLEATDLASLHFIARQGCSGFLTLRRLPNGGETTERNGIRVLASSHELDLYVLTAGFVEDTSRHDIKFLQFKWRIGYLVTSSVSCSQWPAKGGFRAVPIAGPLRPMHVDGQP